MGVINISTSMPPFDPKTKRDETWHKQVIEAIASDALKEDYTFARDVIDLNYHYYQNGGNAADYSFLQEAEDGSPLPATWMNLNRIRNKVNTVAGELAKRSYEIRVEAINEEAKARKLELQNDLRVEMNLKPVAKELEQQYGIPLMPPDSQIPDTAEELDDFMKNYKEMSETVMEFALRFMAKKYGWDYERLAGFRDVLIAGRCFWRVDIINGIPKPVRIDPRFMVFDRESQDDLLTDSTYFGEVELVPISQAATMYDLTTKELEEAYKDAQSVNNNTYRARNTGEKRYADLISNSSLTFFDDTGSELRVLVLKAVWQDTKPNKYRERKDDYGHVHIHREGKGRQKGKQITQHIDIWRRGTLVAGKFMKDWGEMENRPTSVDSFAETLPPYVACLPNYIDYQTISVVDQLRNLQDLKDITWYNVQLEMAASGGKSFVYDISQAPDGWDGTDVAKYLKTNRIAFIDSSRNPGTSFNQFGQVDLSMSAVVKQYLELNKAIDEEMNIITGINDARQGIMQGASQAVGVTQSALYQSSLTTQTLFTIFEMACTRVLDLSARYIKLLWPEEKDRYAPIIGQAGVNFLENDIELDLQDYAVFVESLPKVLEDETMYQNLINFGVQSGSVDFIEAFELLLEKNPREGLLKLKRYKKEKQREAMKAEQARMQAEQNAKQAQEEIKSAAARETNQGANLRQQMGDQSKEKIALAKNKTDLLKTAIGSKPDKSSGDKQ